MTFRLSNPEELAKELAAPFPIGELKFFPVAVSKDGTKGKVGSYIDARAVMDRLDMVVGADSWTTEYSVVDPGTKAVECRLSVRIDLAWVTKADVGYPNEGKDADNADKEPFKAAYSDALKRAAVQFGIGRYIYSLELEKDWLSVDQFKKFTEQPRLKGTAAPARQPAPAAPQRPTAPSTPQASAFPEGELRQLLTDAGLTAADLVPVAGAGDNGGPKVRDWLAANTAKSVRDLVKLAIDAKAVPV